VRYLLDICTISEFVKGHPGVLQRIKTTFPTLLAVSAIGRMEIFHGLALDAARAKKLTPVLDAFFSVVPTLPFDDADAQSAASVRAALRARGQPVGACDLLIAGIALARGLIVVTSNVGEFSRIDGLLVENWR